MMLTIQEKMKELGKVHDSEGREVYGFWCKEVQAEIERLRAALIAAEKVMSSHIYPKPDVGPDHPYSILLQVQSALSVIRDSEEPK